MKRLCVVVLVLGVLGALGCGSVSGTGTTFIPTTYGANPGERGSEAVAGETSSTGATEPAGTSNSSTTGGAGKTPTARDEAQLFVGTWKDVSYDAANGDRMTFGSDGAYWRHFSMGLDWVGKYRIEGDLMHEYDVASWLNYGTPEAEPPKASDPLWQPAPFFFRFSDDGNTLFLHGTLMTADSPWDEYVRE